ncbi:hypothetical protein [Parabacteroides sp. AM08-6]|uniref:hypothetical protein n=1 Tax=Parabacteroides sp. AM08-6 TaxID=2292053 RepID=UPI000F00CB0D|nr:hypothetical protein [Parabacteroides sp. AM08-6]RHJ75650.1 hypothetical protein DW103_17550 [Parabacteroides sp. AM08-6]
MKAGKQNKTRSLGCLFRGFFLNDTAALSPRKGAACVQRFRNINLIIENNEKKETSVPASSPLEELVRKINELRAERLEKGELSRPRRATLNKHIKSLENILQASIIYDEDRIPVKDSYNTIRHIKEIRRLPEFQKEQGYDGRLFRQMLKIFHFKITKETVAHYYYKEEREEDEFP